LYSNGDSIAGVMQQGKVDIQRLTLSIKTTFKRFIAILHKNLLL